MTNWPIGLSTGCFHDKPLLECLEPIRASGFSMVEVVFSPRHLDYKNPAAVREAALRIEGLGMEAYSFHAPFAGDIDISSPELARREFALDEILRAAESASVLGVHYFVIHPGPENAEIPSREERMVRIENVVSVLNRVAQRCSELGIKCVLENKLPHLLFGSSGDIVWILGGLETTEVGACLDTGHAFLAGELYPLVYKLGPHLRMLHVHDNRGHLDDHLPPGEGRIDWGALTRELVMVNFRGAMILELAGSGDPAEVLERARKGRACLRSHCRRVAMALGSSRPASLSSGI
jgi:sugar phosphate isomerase/epimerase